jgi:photosystem II stability/assembly factor-like uncharacterized protein
MRLFNYVLFFMGCCAIASCKKEGVEIAVQEIQLNTANTLQTITFVNDSVGYAAGGSLYALGELFKTTDGGATWSQGDSVLPKQIFCTYFFSENEGFVGGYDAFIAHTYNGSDSWTGIFSFAAYKQVRQINFRNQSHGIVLGGTSVNEGMIYTTKDNGATYKEFLPANAMRAVDFSSDSLVYAVGYGVVFVSHNGGDNWSVLEGIRNDLFCGLKFVTPAIGYMVGWQGGIYKTIDNGRHWETHQKPNKPYSRRVHLLAIDFFDTQHGVVVGEEGLLQFTADGGGSWQVAKQFTSANLTAVQMMNSTEAICCGDGGKVFKCKF